MESGEVVALSTRRLARDARRPYWVDLSRVYHAKLHRTETAESLF
jgi:hypothetical protein